MYEWVLALNLCLCSRLLDLSLSYLRWSLRSQVLSFVFESYSLSFLEYYVFSIPTISPFLPLPTSIFFKNYRHSGMYASTTLLQSLTTTPSPVLLTSLLC
jgi:hypothetical protein